MPELLIVQDHRFASSLWVPATCSAAPGRPGRSRPTYPTRSPSHAALSAAEIRQLKERIHQLERQLKALSDLLAPVKRLLTIPGIGLLTAAALVGFVGEVSRFSSGRRFASYLGLVPREHSSGNAPPPRRHHQARRRLPTYSAHSRRPSVLLAARRHTQPDRLRRWALCLQNRRGHNPATVALANKLARIALAIWTRDVPFESTTPDAT
jgi:transposase